jgi:type II secretory pathway component PulF
LLKSGVHISQAFTIVGETTRNRVYRAASFELARGITKGESISKGLARRRSLFPEMLVHMVSIGETTGNLASTLTYLSDLYEGEVDEQTKNLSSSIEPVLMIIMGILVGLIAVSVITPIYAITQHLSPR